MFSLNLDDRSPNFVQNDPCTFALFRSIPSWHQLWYNRCNIICTLPWGSDWVVARPIVCIATRFAMAADHVARTYPDMSYVHWPDRNLSIHRPVYLYTSRRERSGGSSWYLNCISTHQWKAIDINICMALCSNHHRFTEIRNKDDSTSQAAKSR